MTTLVATNRIHKILFYAHVQLASSGMYSGKVPADQQDATQLYAEDWQVIIRSLRAMRDMSVAFQIGGEVQDWTNQDVPFPPQHNLNTGDSPVPTYHIDEVKQATVPTGVSCLWWDAPPTP